MPATWCVVLALCAAALGQYVPNPHVIPNNSIPYTKNLQFLLEVFNQGTGLPSSYRDTLPDGTVYWATRTYLAVGAFDANGTRVTLDSQIAIQERTLSHYGLNLYDGATWEIALGLWGLWDVAEIYERNILFPSTTGAAGRDNGNPGGIVNIRADSQDFKYGDQRVAGPSLRQITYPGNATHFTQDPDGKPSKTPVKKGPGAFFYRMIGPKYQMIDPMDGNYANAWKYPWPNPDSRTPWNNYGLIHFNDWKPITGENVWGCILGPIQLLNLKTGGNLTNTTCGDPQREPPIGCDWKTYDTTPPPVQLAITVVPALEAMLSKAGSLFHCPWGSKIFPYDPEEGYNVSNENNFSAYSSLKILQGVFKNYTNSSSDDTLTYASKAVDNIVQKMDEWFDTTLFSKEGELPDGQKLVYQGGHINASGYHPVPLDTVGGIAVDCQTWGMTVMGAQRIDKAYGDSMAYKAWQTTKKYAGYYKNGKIAGVGYTSLLGNTSIVPNNKIWSAEWTFGAINMAQTLAGQYKEMGHADYYATLMADAQSMYDEVTKQWPDGLQFSDGSYVYANARFFIPWGWYANPISATCSTAWAVMQERNYDPFAWGGGNKPELQPPAHMFQYPDEPSRLE